MSEQIDASICRVPGRAIDESKPPRWTIRDLLDESAQREVSNFYTALENAQNSTRLIVGYTPPRE